MLRRACETGTAGREAFMPNPSVRYNALQLLEQQEAVMHRANNYGSVGIGGHGQRLYARLRIADPSPGFPERRSLRMSASGS